MEWDIDVNANSAVCTPRKTIKYSGAFVVNHKQIYIKEVIYSNPATIVLWSDGSRTVVKCSTMDCYSEEVGLVMCIMKKQMGNKKFKQLLNSWLPDYVDLLAPTKVTLSDVIKKEKND